MLWQQAPDSNSFLNPSSVQLEQWSVTTDQAAQTALLQPAVFRQLLAIATEEQLWSRDKKDSVQCKHSYRIIIWQSTAAALIPADLCIKGLPLSANTPRQGLGQWGR